MMDLFIESVLEMIGNDLLHQDTIAAIQNEGVHGTSYAEWIKDENLPFESVIFTYQEGKLTVDISDVLTQDFAKLSDYCTSKRAEFEQREQESMLKARRLMLSELHHLHDVLKTVNDDIEIAKKQYRSLLPWDIGAIVTLNNQQYFVADICYNQDPTGRIYRIGKLVNGMPTYPEPTDFYASIEELATYAPRLN